MTHPSPIFAQQAWREAVAKVATQAKASLPDTNGRLGRAVELVLNGHVALAPDGTAYVASQHDGTVYTVRSEHCDCPDFPQAPEGYCKHQIARMLATQAQDLATPPPSTLPKTSRPAAATGHRRAPTPEQLIAQAMAQSEQVCQAAVEATPPAYRGFLMFLPRNKKVSGTKSSPVYAPIREPYLAVDGRVKMAIDEHRDKGLTLVVQTTFNVEPHSGQLLCQATVTSALLGSATAHARVFVGGTGVDETNPLENAETSAVGRALGFLGYGVYGTGIASADEVFQVQAMRQDPVTDASANVLSQPSRAREKPPTARQQGLLKDLLREAGMPEEQRAAQLAQVTTSRQASARIDQLQQQRRQRDA